MSLVERVLWQEAELVYTQRYERVIYERGTHDELLAKQGVYHDLYMRQFRRETAESVGHHAEIETVK